MFSGNFSVDNLDCFSAAKKRSATQKLEDFGTSYKEYITRAFHSPDSTRAPEEWIAADTIISLERRDSEHLKYGFLTEIRPMTYTRGYFRVCKKMQVEVCAQINASYSVLRVLTELARSSNSSL